MDKNIKNFDTQDTLGKLFSITLIKHKQIEVSSTWMGYLADRYKHEIER